MKSQSRLKEGAEKEEGEKGPQKGVKYIPKKGKGTN